MTQAVQLELAMGGPPATRVPARWATPRAPLLPLTLRRELGDQSLPSWLAADLQLPEGATAEALDAAVWERLETLPPRVERFVIGLVASRSADIRGLKVLDGRWPANISPARVEWPARVRTCLQRADLLDPSRLSVVTYGELLDVRAMGVKSLLEFAVIAEAIAGGGVDALDEGVRESLRSAAEEEWAEHIRCDDARFRDVIPPYAGSLAELLEDALNNPDSSLTHDLAVRLPHIRERVEEVATEPLDLALVRCLRATGLTQRNVEMAIARLGWAGEPPRTLQDVGEEFGLTRERVRQIVDRAIGQLGFIYLPPLDRALAHVAERAPIGGDAAGRALVEAGLSTVPIQPDGLGTAADILGYELPFTLERGDGGGYVLSDGLAGRTPVFAVARRQAGRVGVTNVSEVHAELEADGHGYAPEAVAEILRSFEKVEFLDQDWLWIPDIPPDRNRLRNITRVILSVAKRLDVPSIRDGVRRRYRFRRIDVVPPVDVLRAFYRASPEFSVRRDGTVESTRPLDYREVLGQVEQAFVEVLRSSPTGLMDRAEFEQATTASGVNPNTFSVFTTYSPILDHPALNVWCLRGHQVDGAALEALRAITATRPRRRRVLTHGWDEDGCLQVAVEVANVNNPVIGIPAAIRHYLAARQFSARTQEGISAGVITIDETGSSWGYGPYLRRRGAEPRDVLLLQFDLVTEDVTLRLGDDAALME